MCNWCAIDGSSQTFRYVSIFDHLSGFRNVQVVNLISFYSTWIGLSLRRTFASSTDIFCLFLTIILSQFWTVMRGELSFEYTRDQLLSLRLAAGPLPDIAIRRRIDGLLRPHPVVLAYYDSYRERRVGEGRLLSAYYGRVGGWPPEVRRQLLATHVGPACPVWNGSRMRSCYRKAEPVTGMFIY